MRVGSGAHLNSGNRFQNIIALSLLRRFGFLKRRAEIFGHRRHRV